MTTPPPSCAPSTAIATLPTGRLDLLVRAALAPDEEARSAWLAWRSVADLDLAPWNEVRMLGAIAERIATLEPEAAIRPRVAGFRRQIWTLNHVRLRAVRPIVARLVEAGIPLVLVKGSGRIAHDPSVARERFVGDIDALVPPERQVEAGRLLESAGFGLDHQPWQRPLHAAGSIAAHHAWSYRNGHAEIDLHNFAISLNRLRGDDDRLWRSARPVVWREIALRVPGPEHALLLAIAHGLRCNDAEPFADWTVDACRILDAGAFDWELFVTEVRDRLLQAIVLPGLDYLATDLRRPVPEHVLTRLAADRDAELDAELADYAGSLCARTEPDVRRAFAMALRRFARGRPFPQPTQAANVPTVSRVVEFAAGGTVWVGLPLDRFDTDWFVMRVGLELPPAELHGTCLLRILLPGLPVGSVRLLPAAGSASVWRQSFMFPFHRGFLAARTIDRIGICLLRDGQPLLWPGPRTARVDMLAARVGG